MNVVIRKEDPMFELTLTREGALELLAIVHENLDSAQDTILETIKEIHDNLRSILLSTSKDKEFTNQYNRQKALDLCLFLREFALTSRPTLAPPPCILLIQGRLDEFLTGGSSERK